MYKEHYSVLHEECLEFLDGGSFFIDATLGGAGHTSLILNKFPNALLDSIDQDIQAINNTEKNLNHFIDENRLKLHHMNFSEFPNWSHQNQVNKKYDGVLMDLGVSSHQFDEAERGFSFRFDAPLDMRMNQTKKMETAADVLNTYPEEEIEEMIRDYGEEKFSKRIANEIILFRQNKEIETTKELENLIFHCYPKKMRFGKTHPATKTFQALRIFVNRELDVLSESIEKYFELLRPGGKLLIISFHSLEDRIVKRQFRTLAAKEAKYAKILTKKPIIASDQELKENARSRSAKLRVILRGELGEFDKKNKYKKKKEYSED